MQMKSRNKNRKQIFLGVITLAVFVVASFSFFNLKMDYVYAEDAGDIKDSINSIEKKIEKEQNAKTILETELAKILSSVYSTQAQIDKTRALIKQSEENISRMEEEMESMNDKIEIQKEFLKNFLQEVYYNKKQPVASMALFKGDFSKTLGAFDKYLSVEGKIIQIVEEIKSTQEKIKTEQEKIAEAKDDHEKLLENKVVQQYALLADKNETQGDIKEKEATIGELQQKMNELKNDLNNLLGKSYNTNDVKDAIKFANRQTGVDKGFLFGMLSVESRLGASVGGCYYKESRMSDYRKGLFKEICDELDYDYKKKKVSCPPASYTGTGGAMGAAQFMSDTWTGYKSKIANATGHNPPDPWNLVDGVMAMALKLENDGANEKKDIRITSPCNGKKIYVDPEIYASMKYLGWSCYALTNYGPRIQSLAGGYDKL